ncbi:MULTISPECIES: hypothetical protein [Burkholderia]|uniref:hypothetical protein n=1 Tax=Burkholderia TaxID=32008 RepID=UPI000841FFF8|nr:MULTISPECIES: hypothetical protein [unclassified Burkholderia]AOK28868.1 hypothetical protein AQ611_04925 [Burkholderia sp. Bp7605]
MSVMYLSRFHVESPNGLTFRGPYRSKGACTRILRSLQAYHDRLKAAGHVTHEDFSKYRIVETRFVYERTITHEPKL